MSRYRNIALLGLFAVLLILAVLAWTSRGRKGPPAVPSPAVRVEETSLPTASPAPPQEAAPALWPSTSEGLVFLWENAAAANEIRDTTAGLIRSCRLRPRGWTTWAPGHAAEVTRGALASEGNEEILAQTCGAAGAFSLELVLDPLDAANAAGGVLVCYGSSDTEGNLLLYQWNGEGFLRLKSETTPFLKEADIALGPLPAEGPVHLAVTGGPKGLAWYVNGAIQGARPEPPGGLSGWTAHPLVLGQMPQGERNWHGRIEGLAFYQRALSPDEVAQHAASQLARIARRPVAPRSDVDARLIQITPAPSPDSLAPHRAALVEAVYSAEEHLGGAPLSGMIIVQHWAVLDGVSIPATRRVGQRVRLQLAPLVAHPELQGEHVVSTVTEPGLERYLDVGWKEIPTGVLR